MNHSVRNMGIVGRVLDWDSGEQSSGLLDWDSGEQSSGL